MLSMFSISTFEEFHSDKKYHVVVAFQVLEHVKGSPRCFGYSRRFISTCLKLQEIFSYQFAGTGCEKF